MTDYEQLVKALLLCQFGECGCGKCYYKELKGDWCTEDNHPEFFDCDDKLKLDAAAAIEELQVEVDKANKSADAYRAMYFTKRGDITIEKVRKLDEIDCHFHSSLIRLMYRRIGELEAAQPHWVSVDERLPDDTRDVLAVRRYGNNLEKQEVIVAHLSVIMDMKRGFDKWWNATNITHWMPFPEPPQEDA